MSVIRLAMHIHCKTEVAIATNLPLESYQNQIWYDSSGNLV